MWGVGWSRTTSSY
ncbi:hypothetical protein HID58_067449 [Brassica napus]|uniref:Uncharacterized protein n=1 Tax=Brassica napus TaxID=3708 RepID=A0ABQ7ZIL3_BRANA|nr:hypothetical protein HID58_067449 [Brassica napus]